MADEIKVGAGAEKPKGHIRAIWAITIIVVIAILVGGGIWYFFYKTAVQDDATTNTAKTSASVSPSASGSALPSTSGADETTNWKTYTDKEYGFSVKYPLNAMVNISRQESATGDVPEYFVFFTDKTDCGNDAQCANTNFTIQVLDNRRNYTGKQWVDANYTSSEEIKTRNEVTVDGIKGEKITSDRGVEGYKMVFVQSPPSNSGDTLMYEFSWKGNDKNLDHIFDLFLGSFKFKK